MTKAPTSNMDVKRRNRASTLRCALECGRVSQQELSRRLELSWPTILQNVKELAALGLLREDGVYDSTGGRKARAYVPVPEGRVAVGLDVARDHVSVVLVDLQGRLLEKARGALRFSREEVYLRYLGGLVRRFVETYQAEERLLGVGIALPGIVDGGLLRDSPEPEMKNLPLTLLEEQFPWPCRFLSAAHAAGLAEGGSGDLIYLSLGDSVEGAVLRGGRLWKGDRLRAGSFGHSTLAPGGRRCRCGRAGCLDAYCSAQVLSDQAGGSLSAFFQALQAGDPEKRERWREYLEYLAVAVNNLHAGFDCDIVAGGPVGAYLGEFGELLRALLAERNPFGPDASYLKECRCEEEPAAIGAAMAQVEAYLEDPC